MTNTTFCQYGGHDSTINPRKGGNLTTIRWPDNQTNATMSWLVCDECKNKLGGDPTMDILLLWANEVSSVDQLPGSVLLELTQQCVISDIFLTDIQNTDESTSISLKLWVGATMAAKGTRATFNVSGGQQWYAITERIQAFKAVDKLASNDEIVRIGAEVAPVVELLVRSHDFISLEGCDSDSPIRKYVKKDAVLQYITSNDLVIKIDSLSD